MNRSELILAELIKSSLFGVKADLPEDVDWAKALKEARAQTVVALTANAAAAGIAPAEISQEWSVQAYQSKAFFMRALYEQTKVCELFKEAEIPFVILKGAAAAMYYPTPCDRTMGDVDVFVSEEFFDRAFSLLKDNGYEYKLDYGDGRDYSFEKGGVIFELHRRYSDKGHDIEQYIVNGLKNAQTQVLYGDEFPTLPKAENGLVLLDHIRHHLSGGLGIRQIIDFMMFVCSEKDGKVFEEKYLPLFESAGLKTLAKIITKACIKYFGLPVNADWCKDADEKTCDQLMETVFAYGNFGRKDPYVDRPMRDVTMSFKKRGFFRTLQDAGVANCEAFRKHKFLRPFAWIYQAFRYLIRGLKALFKGEKLFADVAEGKKKADFYKRLGI